MERGEFANETIFFSTQFQRLVFNFSKNQTVDIFRVLFLSSHLGWKEIQNYSIGYVFICQLRN